MEHQIRFGDTAPKGTITLGAYDSIARYLMSGFIKFITAAAPDLKVNMITARSKALLEKVEKKEIDLAVIVQPPEVKPSLNLTVIYSDLFDLFAAPSMHDSFRNTLIYLPLEINDPEASKQRFRFTQSIVCESLETVLTLTEQGIGVGLLPSLVTKESVLAKRLVNFDHPKIKGRKFDPHNIVICQRKHQRNDTTKYVFNELTRYFEQWR